MVTKKVITMNTKGEIIKEYPMNPRHKIDKEYESNPRHLRRWELTIEWLKQFEFKNFCLDCGDWTPMTFRMELEFDIHIINTIHDLDKYRSRKGFFYQSIFAFEVIEHLLNPLVFMQYCNNSLSKKGFMYISTPINRPKWMRNREWHFHEFNYNELVHLIDVAGFKIVAEKRINCTKWYYAFTGFRPLLRVLGYDKNILLRLKRK